VASMTAAALGRLGEELALGFFTACGYECLARRYRRAGGEVDLIVGRRQLVVFVEVKARGPGSWTPAHAAVTTAQLRRLRTAAQAWLAEQPAPLRADLRCDVVAVQFGGEGRGVMLRHFPGVG
jgi:putative endonuclease